MSDLKMLAHVDSIYDAIFRQRTVSTVG